MRTPWICALAVPLLTLTSPAGAFVHVMTEDGTPIRWEASCVPWFMHAGSFSEVHRSEHGLAYEATFEVARQSYETWNDVLDQYVRFQGRGATCFGEVGTPPWPGLQNLVRWRTPTDPWPYAARTVGLTSVSFDQTTGSIVDADIEMNGQDYHFSLDGEPNAYDLESSLTHEVGHVLGLDHSPQLLATMFKDSAPGETHKRTLHEDDIAGVIANHPVADLPPDSQCGELADVATLDAPDCPAEPPVEGCHAAAGFSLEGWLLALVMGIMGRREPRGTA